MGKKHKKLPALEPERYSDERKAEFLLSNAITYAEYLEVRKAVRRVGLDPDSIPHARPDKSSLPTE